MEWRGFDRREILCEESRRQSARLGVSHSLGARRICIHIANLQGAVQYISHPDCPEHGPEDFLLFILEACVLHVFLHLSFHQTSAQISSDSKQLYHFVSPTSSDLSVSLPLCFLIFFSISIKVPFLLFRSASMNPPFFIH